MEKKFAHYKETGGEAWEELKVGISDLWNSFDRCSKFREKKDEAAEDFTEKKNHMKEGLKWNCMNGQRRSMFSKQKLRLQRQKQKNIYIEQIEDLKSKQELFSFRSYTNFWRIRSRCLGRY